MTGWWVTLHCLLPEMAHKAQARWALEERERRASQGEEAAAVGACAPCLFQRQPQWLLVACLVDSSCARSGKAFAEPPAAQSFALRGALSFSATADQVSFPAWALTQGLQTRRRSCCKKLGPAPWRLCTTARQRALCLASLREACQRKQVAHFGQLPRCPR